MDGKHSSLKHNKRTLHALVVVKLDLHQDGVESQGAAFQRAIIKTQAVNKK
jgi:hypothetical protein